MRLLPRGVSSDPRARPPVRKHGMKSGAASDTIRIVMPIYDYRCRQCKERFELLVLGSTVPACPACQSQDLEQLISGFAVSSESSRQANLQAARRKYASSSNYRDQKAAEAEEIKEHAPQYFQKPK
jgi:putative FmdB family regulatory protein